MSHEQINYYPLIKSLFEYLDPKYGMGHRAGVMRELEEILSRINHRQNILDALLTSPAFIPLRMLEVYLENVGLEVLSQMTNLDDEPISPVYLSSFENASADERRRLIEILGAYAEKPLRSSMIADLAKIAILESDTQFLSWLDDKHGIDDEVLWIVISRKTVIEEAVPASMPMLRDILGSADFSSEVWTKIATTAVVRSQYRTVAVLIASGWKPRAILENQLSGHSGGSWALKMLKRLNSSSHAELKFHASFPSLDQVFEMDRYALKVLMGGQSPRELKKLERLRKREESRQYFIDRNLPLPKGLQNES